MRPTKATTQKKPTTGERIIVRMPFTNEDYKTRNADMLRAMQTVEEKDLQVKANAASARAEIKQLKARVNDLANQLRNGYEDKEVEALVEFNRKTGVKRYYHHCPGQSDHKKFIRQEPMTEEDYALLPFENPEPKPVPDKPINDKPAEQPKDDKPKGAS